MDDKHRKLVAIKRSKGCKLKFMPKMHQNLFGGRAPLEPAGGAYAVPRSPSRNGGPTSKRSLEGVGGEGGYLKGMGGTPREGRA